MSVEFGIYKIKLLCNNYIVVAIKCFKVIFKNVIMPNYTDLSLVWENAL